MFELWEFCLHVYGFFFSSFFVLHKSLKFVFCYVFEQFGAYVGGIEGTRLG